MKKIIFMFAALLAAFTVVSCDKDDKDATSDIYGMWEFDKTEAGSIEYKTKTGTLTLPGVLFESPEDIQIKDEDVIKMLKEEVDFNELAGQARLEIIKNNEKNNNALLVLYSLVDGQFVREEESLLANYANNELVITVPVETAPVKGMLMTKAAENQIKEVKIGLIVKQANKDVLTLSIDKDHFMALLPQVLLGAEQSGTEIPKEMIDMFTKIIDQIEVFTVNFNFDRVVE